MACSWINKHGFHRLLEESQLQNVEKALVLANPDSSFWQKEKELHYTQGHVVSGDLSAHVVAVCGIVLPRLRHASEEQVWNPQLNQYVFVLGVSKYNEVTLFPDQMVLRYRG